VPVPWGMLEVLVIVVIALIVFGPMILKARKK
jgi:Sec-independent protein translocase protein TatA